MQDRGQLNQKPGKGCRRGEWLWARRPQQSRATSGCHYRDNREKRRGHSGTNRGPQPCRNEWEITQIWVRTEERRGQWSREVPPPNTPLIHRPICLRVHQHFNNLWVSPQEMSWCIKAPGWGWINHCQEQVERVVSQNAIKTQTRQCCTVNYCKHISNQIMDQHELLTGSWYYTTFSHGCLMCFLKLIPPRTLVCISLIMDDIWYINGPIFILPGSNQTKCITMII